MTETTKKNYTHRYLARIIIEAETPIAVGSGEKDILSDALVATDVNGLPYIPGTSIAGVVRSMFDDNEVTNNLFGYQEGKKGLGSRIIFTEAKIMDYSGKVMDGLDPVTDGQFKKDYGLLPIRQHARINDKGTVAKHGKFDEQIVFAGTRFCFEVEIVSEGEEFKVIGEVISHVSDKSFRLGSGSRSGFGQIKVINVRTVDIDLMDADSRGLYLEKSSELNLSGSWEGWSTDNIAVDTMPAAGEWVSYCITLSPDNFFMFGSGFGDEDGDADMTSVRAAKVVWAADGKSAELKKNLVLMPATSLKGALRHRVAYNYNKKVKRYVESGNGKDADKNEAVEAIFGSNKDEKDLKRGNILMSDIIMVDSDAFNRNKKLINHVAIDRFTGGAIDGALFTEQVDYGTKEDVFETEILVRNSAIADADIEFALEQSLKDLCRGMLPLGGGVNRGNGIFTGVVTKDGGPLK